VTLATSLSHSLVCSPSRCSSPSRTTNRAAATVAAEIHRGHCTSLQSIAAATPPWPPLTRQPSCVIRRRKVRALLGHGAAAAMNAEQSSCMSLYLASLPALHLFPSFSCLGLMLLSGGWPPANAEASKAAAPLAARHRSM
jgi:hypothetical protein